MAQKPAVAGAVKENDADLGRIGALEKKISLLGEKALVPENMRWNE